MITSPGPPDRSAQRVLAAACAVETASIREALLVGGVVRSILGQGHFDPSVALIAATRLAHEARVPVTMLTVGELQPVVTRFSEAYQRVVLP